jgi:hypothetical protein
LLRVEKTTEGLEEQIQTLLQHVRHAALRGERDAAICDAFRGVTRNAVQRYAGREKDSHTAAIYGNAKDGEKNF